jgi:hypothetical protein
VLAAALGSVAACTQQASAPVRKPSSGNATSNTASMSPKVALTGPCDKLVDPTIRSSVGSAPSSVDGSSGPGLTADKGSRETACVIQYGANVRISVHVTLMTPAGRRFVLQLPWKPGAQPGQFVAAAPTEGLGTYSILDGNTWVVAGYQNMTSTPVQLQGLAEQLAGYALAHHA